MREYNDYELLMMVRDGNEEAINLLYIKYRPIVVKFSREAIHRVSHHGIEISDIMQEGYIGLDDAINGFCDNDETSFYTFAVVCIKRRIINFLRRNSIDRIRTLNDSISLDDYLEKNLGDIVDTEVDIVNKDYEGEIFSLIRGSLTKFEREVFDYKASGYSFKEIAVILEKDLKSIYNTFNRIKKKAKRAVEEEESLDVKSVN